MLTIWKYPIDPSFEKIELAIPGGGPAISAGLDARGDVCVWAMVDDDLEEEIVKIYCVGTGWPLDRIMEDVEALKFIGTVKEGFYMWHIFTEEVVE